MKVIEKIAREIQSELTEDGVAIGIAQAILSLKQEAPCPLCKGESRKLIHGDKIEIRGCTLCKGAGFMPLLALLDSDQSYEIDEGLHPDSKIAVKDMITQGWRKVVIE